MKYLLLSLLILAPVLAQQDNPVNEQFELQQAVGEAGANPAEFIRALEAHLKKFPKTERREELERAIFKAALEAKDDERIIRYGERAIADDTASLETLDRVSRSLLAGGAKEKAAKALDYAKRLEERLRKNDGDQQTQEKLVRSGRDRARFRDEMDRSLGRALLSQAKANLILGNFDTAITLARNSYQQYPTADAARELANTLITAGKSQEAVDPLTDAFALADQRSTERAADRKRLGEIYTSLKGNETGLGDAVLRAFDRTTALLAKRRQVLKQFDPNLDVTNPMDFTLTGLKGETLPLSSLRGKVVVLDFWATWCGPCRAQYPLYEQVKKRYKDRKDVVFLAINTDEDHSVVEPFLKEQNWNKNVYFEDGLSNLLRVSSIPTTMIFGPQGSLVTRMNGYLPDRFVEMLSARIDAALEKTPGE